MNDILGDRYYWYSAKMHKFLQQQIELPDMGLDWAAPSKIYLLPDGGIATYATTHAQHDCGWDDMHLVCKARFLSARRIGASDVEVRP